MIVRLFKRQFAPLVESGAKLQTVRPRPKRRPHVGEPISLRAWTGQPYRSKQRVLRETVLTRISDVVIGREELRIECAPNTLGSALTLDDFARADGFADWAELVAWFDAEHGLPFEGVLLGWPALEETP